VSEFAKRIHALYNEKQRALGNSVTEWDDLPDDFKYSNVRQARSISLKLAAIGCYTAVKPRNAADQVVKRRTRIGADGREEDVTFSDEEIETMSRLEHDLWVEERESTGWIYDRIKDTDKRKSPYMVPWEYLSKEIQGYDEDTCRSIPLLLESVGLRIYRKGNHSKAEGYRYLEDRRLPIIISTSGHQDITPESRGAVEEGVKALVEELRRRYSNTRKIVLMSALAEGADRMIARAAIEEDVLLAPVLPMPEEEYKKTFQGCGFYQEGSD